MKNSVFLFSLFLFWFLFSCNQSNDTSKSTVETLEFAVSTISIPLDSLSLKSYNLLSSFDNYIYGYNRLTHSIDVFEPGNDSVHHIALDKEGVNGVMPGINGLYIHSEDSLFISNDSEVYLITKQGEVKNKISLIELSGQLQLMLMKNYSIATIELYYNKNRNSIFCLAMKPLSTSEFYICEIEMSSRKCSYYKMQIPSYFKENNGEFGWKRLPNITPTDSIVYYNYPAVSSIYSFHLYTGEEKEYQADSKYVKNHSEPLAPNNTFQRLEGHKISNSHFFGLQYDPFKRFIYRLQVGESDYDVNSDIVKAYYNKNLYLSVFDEKMNVLGEIELSSKRYNYATAWLVNDTGLLLTVDNIHNQNQDDEKLEFDCIAIK